MIVFGAPVVRRYDLLNLLCASIRRSTLQPDLLVVIDNGGNLSSDLTFACDSFARIAPGKNVGCAGAWNLIIDQAESPDDIVIISNDDLELMPESLQMIIDAAQETDLVIAHNFSLFSVKRALVDRIGFFDEHFFPAYYEDEDFHRRVKLAGASWKHVAVPCTHVGSASLKALSPAERKEAGLLIGKSKAYYAQKWGGIRPKTIERFDKPFNGRPPNGWKLRCVTT